MSTTITINEAQAIYTVPFSEDVLTEGPVIVERKGRQIAVIVNADEFQLSAYGVTAACGSRRNWVACISNALHSNGCFWNSSRLIAASSSRFIMAVS